MTKSSSSTWKTMIAAIVTTALAGTALFLAAGSGDVSEPRAPEVAYESGSGSSERIEAMKARIEKTRARIAGLGELEQAEPDPVTDAEPVPDAEPTPTKRPTKKPTRTKPQPKPDPVPTTVHIDPECLRNPLCVK